MSLMDEVLSDTKVQDLPNLKIEIENDLEGKMDTDDEDHLCGKATTAVSSETEEGELVDDDEDYRLSRTKSVPGTKSGSATINSQIVPTGRSILKYDTKEYLDLQQQQSAVKNPNGAFVTGVDIFSPEEQAKLDKRAQRFGIEASESKVMTEKLLKKLYKSMGVKPSDENIRLEALHMRGTEQMATQDVFNFFKDYGPASLEWITDNSCNVVWLDSISAARALLGLSVHISGLVALECEAPGRAALAKRKGSLSDSDVEMEPQVPTDKPAEEEDVECLSEESDAVAVDSLDVDLPPGCWRRGAPDPLSPCVLLRFATTSDRSQPKRPGYAKFGSHSFGGYVGLISQSRKRRMQGALPTPMFDDVGDEILPKPAIDETDSSNPWGVLAKTWSRFDKVRKPRPPSPIIERILPLPSRMTPPPSLPSFLTPRVRLVARTRMRREAARRVSDPEPEEGSDAEEWASRSKVPRMRMHADDEEKKREKRVKRSHRNRMILDSSPPPKRDIRHRIGVARPASDDEVTPEPLVEEPDDDCKVEEQQEEEEEEEEVPDLRVAVAADRSLSPEDTKQGLRERLFNTAGNVKSVLRGARGQSNDEDEDEGESEDEEVSRKHHSRSKERRKQHRKHKESAHHKSRRREDSDSDSNDRSGKIKSTIRRKSPDAREKRASDGERRSHRETRDGKSPTHRRRRKEEEYRRRKEDHRKSDRESRRHGGGDSRVGKDLRSKIAHSKTYDYDNEFRSKSPLQIEIDNDEYYNKSKAVDSD